MWFYCNELRLLVKSLQEVEEMCLARFEFVEITDLVANVLMNHILAKK